MSDTSDETAETIAARGREALVARLRPAFEEAAAAHADVLQLGPDQIESMVQRAADRADGLQWRRALAAVATEELGISLGEALSHPAVIQAQTLLGAPSYEASLAELTPSPASAPSKPADAAQTPAPPVEPEPEPVADEPEPEAVAPEPEPESEAAESEAAAPEPEADPAAPEPEGVSAEPEAEEAQEPEAVTPEPEAVTPEPEAVTPEPEAVTPEPDAEPEPEPDAESGPEVEPEPEAAEHDEPQDASDSVSDIPKASDDFPGTAEYDVEAWEDEYYDDEGLRVSVIHLGGIANLAPAEADIELLMSDDGLDIIRASTEVLGRLEWRQVTALEVDLPKKGRRRSRKPSPTYLVIRTEIGNASFEVPDVGPEELRQHLAPVIADHIHRL